MFTDKNGNLTGYMNGAGFLSYHESEIMMLTLERLMDEGIAAYPVHDCLMVKVSDAKQAAYVYQGYDTYILSENEWLGGASAFECRSSRVTS